ncbi:mucin-1 isoform X1 [Serinus canaria]|uniref:mucin-1 isoform X1 n=1 Tax=Serinus canaria TaxID=9135 RepID=UPI0021CD14A5|nr:mucin-1 isoform X1 [Serinus canaria]
MLRAERGGAAGTAPCPAARGAVPARSLCCTAFLLLAVCVRATAVPYGLGALAAVTWGPPGSAASQRGVGDTLGTACGDLLSSGCSPGMQGDVTPGAGAGGQSLGTGTAATRTSGTSLQGQAGSGHREGLRLGTAMAVTLSPTPWPGKRVPAASARLFQPQGPSPAGATVAGMGSTAPGVIPELGQTLVTEESTPSQPRTASVGPVPTAAGPPGPSPASPGSVPPPCSTEPALQRASEPGHRTATSSSVTSPCCPLRSPGAGHAASSLLSSQSLAVPSVLTLHAHAASSGSSTSQNSSTATEQLPAATRVASSPAELMTKGRPGSTGRKPPASHPSSLPLPSQPVHVLPLQFRLLGIAYGPALGSRNSESYRQLEGDVTLMLNQMLSSYESFLQANVLEFLNGSVVVRGQVLFRGDAPAPSNSHLIRTVVTEASKGRSIFSWQLEPQSVQSAGFSLENLDPEKLSISLTGSQLGMDSMESLVREVTASVSALYHVRNFTISQLRKLGGNTEITGDLYLDTVVHADVTEVLEALTALSGLSMALSSLSLEGSQLGLLVYPLSFVVTNRAFSQKLQDPLSAEHHHLSRHLGEAVARALRDYPSFLTAIIKEFLPGSLICHGNIIFRRPAPTSAQVLRALVRSVGPDQALAGSDIHVDPSSLSVGEDTLEPARAQPGFPAYGVALVVIGSLCIVAAPVVLVCLGTKRLGWQAGGALWDRTDPDVGIQTLEMENQGFWTEDLEDGHLEWQSTSA